MSVRTATVALLHELDDFLAAHPVNGLSPYAWRLSCAIARVKVEISREDLNALKEPGGRVPEDATDLPALSDALADYADELQRLKGVRP